MSNQKAKQEALEDYRQRREGPDVLTEEEEEEANSYLFWREVERDNDRFQIAPKTKRAVDLVTKAFDGTVTGVVRS